MRKPTRTAKQIPIRKQRIIRMVQALSKNGTLPWETAQRILECIQTAKGTKETPNACETIFEVRRLWGTQTLDWLTTVRIVKCIQKVTKRSDTDCLEALLARSVKRQDR